MSGIDASQPPTFHGASSTNAPAPLAASTTAGAIWKSVSAQARSARGIGATEQMASNTEPACVASILVISILPRCLGSMRCSSGCVACRRGERRPRATAPTARVHGLQGRVRREVRREVLLAPAFTSFHASGLVGVGPQGQLSPVELEDLPARVHGSVRCQECHQWSHVRSRREPAPSPSPRRRRG